MNDKLAAYRNRVHIGEMADPDKAPVMIPFKDQAGSGWHVIIRYHAGHERRIEGFATEDEARSWIVENANELDE